MLQGTSHNADKISFSSGFTDHWFRVSVMYLLNVSLTRRHLVPLYRQGNVQAIDQVVFKMIFV